MNVLKKAAAIAALAALPLTSHAVVPLIDVEAGAGIWSYSPSGFIQPDSSNTWDVEDDFHLERDRTGFLWAAFKHPIPLLPDVRLTYTPIKTEGEGSTSKQWNGQTFTTNMKTRVEMQQVDALLFYSPLDNIVKLDFGVNIKYIDGKFTAEDDTGTQETTTFSAPIPMAHLGVGASLPFTGLTARAEVNTLSVGEHSVSDSKASIRFKVLPTLRIEAGYREQRVKLDGDDYGTDVKLNGPYASLLLEI